MTEINDAMLEQVSGGAGKADMIIKVMNSSLPAEIKKKLVNCMKGSTSESGLQAVIGIVMSEYPELAEEIQQIFSD